MKRGSRAAAAGLVVLVASALGAQAPDASAAARTTTADAAVLQRIWRLGMDSSRAERLAQALMDSVGPRLTGTVGMRRASDWAIARYREWGVAARTERYGTWRGWRRGAAHLDLVAPRVRSLEATLLGWSPGTGGKPVQGPVAVFPELADSAAFDAWLPRVRGRFVMTSFPHPTCRPNESWQRNASSPEAFDRMRRERDSAQAAFTEQRIGRTRLPIPALLARLERAGALGTLTSSWPGAWGTTRVFTARTTRVPSYVLSCEDYGLVWRLAERGQGPVLRATADAELLGDVPAYNTLAEVRGAELPDEYVVLSAHFDSYDGASGATDNGTGTIMMMEAMRILRLAYPRPRRTILAAHWAGEEEGLNGSQAFVADHPEVVRGIQALFNQDNGTGRTVGISMQGFSGAGATFRRWLAAMPAELSTPIRLGDPDLPGSGGTDASSFVCAGVPAFELGGVRWDYNPYTWHTNRDTYDKVVIDDLKANATLVAMLAYLAAEDARFPRDRVDLTGVRNQRGEPFTWPECGRAARSWGESSMSK